MKLKTYTLIIWSLCLIGMDSFAQCVPAEPPLPATVSQYGRTLTFTNVSVNGGGNFANVAPGAAFTLSFNFNVGTTITYCPGCITYAYIGVAGVDVPGGPSGTSYANTNCFGSIYAGQNGVVSPVFTAPTTPGYYYITYYSTLTYWCHQFRVVHNNCQNSAIGLIVVGNPPSLGVTVDSTFNVSTCGGTDGSIYLTPSGGTGAGTTGCYQYNWSDGSSAEDLTGVPAGNYSVTVTDANCDTVLNFTITEPGFGFALPNDTTFCEGDTLTLNIGTQDSIQWMDGSIDSIYTITQTDTYSVEVWSGACSELDSIIVTFETPANIDLGNDTTLCENESLLLDPNVAATAYNWQDGSNNPTYLVTDSGLYWLKVEIGVCSVYDSIQVSYDPIPLFDIGNDSTLCSGDSVLLDATISNGQYAWQDGSGNATFNAMTSGIYWVDVFSGVCQERDSVELQFDNPPVVDLGNDTSLCIGEQLTLDAFETGAQYTWSDGSVNSDLIVTASGDYWVDVNLGVCATSDTINVDFEVPPSIDQIMDVDLCVGDSTVLDATIPGFSSYIWQDGSTGPTYSVASPGTYWVDIAIGVCIVRDSAEVNYDQQPVVSLPPQTLLCDNDILTLDVSGAGTDYLWSTGSSQSSINVSDSGLYWVLVTNGACMLGDTAQVQTGLRPIVDLGVDESICDEKAIDLVLDATNVGATYEWQDFSTDSVLQVTEAGIYYVSVSNQCGIVGDTIMITTENCGCTLYFPTAFSPNDDGQNDFFQPMDNGCEVAGYQLRIFNRWGETVFEASNPGFGWDGFYKEELQPMTTYAWVATYKIVDSNGESRVTEKGSVTLIY